jgi:hypothetical protein
MQVQGTGGSWEDFRILGLNATHDNRGNSAKRGLGFTDRLGVSTSRQNANAPVKLAERIGGGVRLARY